MTVLEKTSQEDSIVQEDSTTEDHLHLTDNQEKCTKQNAATVDMNVKYHSDQQKENLYIAKTALQNEEIN